MVDVTLSLIGANGDEIVFSDEGDFVLTSGLAGLGIPATQVRIDDSASDGGVWRFSKRGVRELDLPVVVLGADRATVEANLRRLTLLLSDRVGGVVLQAAYSSGEVWHLTQGHYVAGASGVRGDDGGLAWERWVLSLQFANPFWISQASESFAVGAPASSGSFLPNLAELVVSSAQAVGSVTVENPGDVDAFPVWSLRGPADSVTVSNGVESFVYDAPILASSTVVVDTAAGTVTDQLGVNKYGSLAASPSLFALPAGTSQVSVTATNASAGSWVDVETLATQYVANASMEASSGSSAIRTNLVTNPSGESVVPGTVVMRRNLSKNPRGVSGGSTSEYLTRWGWPLSYRTDGSTGLPTGVTSYVRFTSPSALTGGGRGMDSYGNQDTAPGTTGDFIACPVQAGQTYTVSYYVRASFVGSLDVKLNFHAGAGSWVATTTKTTYTYSTSGEWVRVSHTMTAPSGYSSLYLAAGLHWSSITFNTSSTFDVAGMVVEASSVVGDFFDGSTTDALGWDYAWLGTANASISTAASAATTVRTNLSTNPSSETAALGTAGAGTATVAVSTTQKYVGTQSTKLTWVSGAVGLAPAPSFTATAGQVYTVSVYVFWESGEAPYLEVQDQSYGNIPGVSGVRTPTAMGSWQRLWATFTVPAGATQFRVYDLVTSASTYYMDAVLIEQSSILGDFFDGSFNPAGDFSYGWTGTANASTSIQRGATIATVVAGWAGGNYADIQTNTDFKYGSKSWKSICTSPQTFLRGVPVPLTSGTTYTFSAWVKPSITRTFRIVIQGSAGISDGSFVSCPAGQWTQISRTGAPTSTGTFNVYVNSETGASVGDSYLIDGLLVEASPIVGAYFDGTTISNDSDFTIAWNGYAHASTSSFYADAISGINGMTPVNAVSNRSSQWFKVGTKSYRIIPTQTGNESYGYTPTYTVTPGKQYTATGVVRIPEPLLGTLHADALKLRVNINNGTSYVKTVAAPNIAGEYTLTVTFTAPTGASTARLELMNGASAGNGNVWWDTVGLIDLPDSPFFDGNTTSLRENAYAWTGTANDSTSVWKRREIQGATLISCNYQPRKEIVH